MLNLAGAINRGKGLVLVSEAACWRLPSEKLTAARFDEEQFQAATAPAGQMFERHRGAR